jgi:hypothetical protein
LLLLTTAVLFSNHLLEPSRQSYGWSRRFCASFARTRPDQQTHRPKIAGASSFCRAFDRSHFLLFPVATTVIMTKNYLATVRTAAGGSSCVLRPRSLKARSCRLWQPENGLDQGACWSVAVWCYPWCHACVCVLSPPQSRTRSGTASCTGTSAWWSAASRATRACPCCGPRSRSSAASCRCTMACSGWTRTRSLSTTANASRCGFGTVLAVLCREPSPLPRFVSPA